MANRICADLSLYWSHLCLVSDMAMVVQLLKDMPLLCRLLLQVLIPAMAMKDLVCVIAPCLIAGAVGLLTPRRKNTAATTGR